MECLFDPLLTNLSTESIRRAGGKSAKFLPVAIPRSSMAEHSTVNRTVVGSSPTAGALRPGHVPGHFSLTMPKAAHQDSGLPHPIHPRATQPRRSRDIETLGAPKAFSILWVLFPSVQFRRDAHRLIGLNPFCEDAWEVTDAPCLRNRFHNHCLYCVRGTRGTEIASPQLAFLFIK